MVYLEHTPAAPLNRVVKTLWYCCAPDSPSTRQRVLPTGNLQIILNLAGECLHDFRDDTAASQYAVPAAILAGPRSHYDWVDTRDLHELVGVVFLAGGAAPFFREHAAGFRLRTLPLADLLPLHDIRGRLQEVSTPADKLRALESWLVCRMQPHAARMPVIAHATELLRHHGVRETAQKLGFSERKLHTLMTAEAGFSPKTWNRLHRFQRAVQALHAGTHVRWDELALECGFYDQSHFSNEFKAFAGISPSTYSQATRPWASQIQEP